TIVGRYLIDQYGDACRSWPVEPVPNDWYDTFQSQIPVLFLSGFYDPSTPAEAAESVRVSFPNSAHIVVRNAGHGAGFGCAREVVEDFLVMPSVDDVHDPCPDEPIRFQVRGTR
ncbi:MAG: alpha/beta hydrolase, partial [Longimicrobiales bacterium]